MRLGHVYASVRYAACEEGAALARASQREWVGDAHRAEAGRVEGVFGRDDVVDLPPARLVVGARVAHRELVQLESRVSARRWREHLFRRTTVTVSCS